MTMKQVSAFTGLVLVGLFSCLPAVQRHSVSEAERYLHGHWVLGEVPRDGLCSSVDPTATSLFSFEFGNGPGRLMTFQGFDALYYEPLGVYFSDDGTLALRIVWSEPSAGDMKIRRLSEDSFEMYPPENMPDAGLEVAYRCVMPPEPPAW